MDVVRTEEQSNPTTTLERPVEPSKTILDPPLPSKHRLMSRLEKTEWRRRVWHIIPGFLPILLWIIPHRDPISPTLRFIVLAIVISLAAGIFRRYRLIARKEDTQRSTAVFGYALSVLLTVLFFPAHLQLGLTVLAVLAFGDGSATLVGKICRGPLLPWNREKTWSGFIAFLLFGGLAASVVYWGETYFNPETLNAAFPFSTALVCGMVTGLMAAAAESLPSRLNDNIRVGVTAAVTVAAMHGILIGWS